MKGEREVEGGREMSVANGEGLQSREVSVERLTLAPRAVRRCARLLSSLPSLWWRGGHL